jgi:hypothetical protein
MPHYRFSAVFNGTHDDQIGEFLIDDETARLHAIQVIHELKHNCNPTFYDGWSMRVTDGERQVATIPFDASK